MASVGELRLSDSARQKTVATVEDRIKQLHTEPCEAGGELEEHPIRSM